MEIDVIKDPQADIQVKRVNNRSPAFPIKPDEVDFFMNYTGFRDGNRIFCDHISTKLLSMIDRAQEFILLSVFLLDNFYSKSKPDLDIVTPLVDRLVAKRNQHPSIRIAIILDPSNKAYGHRLSPAEKQFRENGIDVFYSDLLGGLDRSSLLGLREGFGHFNRIVDGLTFRRWGVFWSNLFARAKLPGTFDGDPVSLETAYNAFLLKANHRKLLVTDVQGGDLETLITTANPHNPSAYHINSAISVRGEPAKYIYNMLRADALQSIRLGGLYTHWHYNADNLYCRSYGDQQFPALPMGQIEDQEGPQVWFVSERKILHAVLELLEGIMEGDEVRIQMFYLSSRPVVRAILEASCRTQKPIRLLLDANKDSFNMEKDGTPNRQVARYLLREADRRGGQLQIRWYSTHGEQNHVKTLSITHRDRNRFFLMTGSANWTSRNLAGVNMEANVVTEGLPNINQPFDDLFDLFWTNEDGSEYSLPYESFKDQTGKDWKWRLGERPFYFSGF